MKKYLKVLFIAIFAFAVFNVGSKSVSAQEVPYPTPLYGLVTAPSGLFIYQQPDDTMGQLSVMAECGWIVDVIGQDGDYSHIKFYYGNINNIATGWVKKSAGLTVTQAPVGETFTQVFGYIGINNFDKTDVRSTSNIKDAFAVLPKGQKVNIIATSNSWYQVQLWVNGVVRTGYVYKKLMTPVDAFNSNAYLNMSVPKGMKKGKTYQLGIADAFPVRLGKTVTWKSSNTKVATVSKTGKFKIKKKGNCTITATVKYGNRVRAIKLRLRCTSLYKFSK